MHLKHIYWGQKVKGGLTPPPPPELNKVVHYYDKLCKYPEIICIK